MPTKSEICLTCLECCRYISIHMPMEGDPAIYKEFCLIRDLELVDIKDGTVFIRIKKPCFYLAATGCSIYPDRPTACRTYDGTKDGAMADKCKWKNLNEDK